MVAVKGKDKRIKIDVAGTMTEVKHQGDTTFNLGKSASIVSTKNSKVPVTDDEGATLTFSILKERPAIAAHTALVNAAASETPISCEFADKNSGGEMHTGDVVVTLGEETTNVQGALEQQVTLSFVDDPVPGLVA